MQIPPNKKNNKNNMQGWIKLHRQISENPFCSKSLERLGFWTKLLLMVNHADKVFYLGCQKLTCKAGQIVTGRKSLALECGIDESKVERFLKRLETEHQIEQQKTNKFRLITIVNWEQFQQERTPNRTTDEQQMNTNKNVKNVKKKEIYKEKKVFINYGEYVRLTETQYSALSETYSEPVLKSKIEDINNYCASHNKSYKDYSAVIRSWMKREGFIHPFNWSKYTDEELMPILKERPELCKEAQIKRPTALFLSQTMT